jgi:hypothetical protein
MVPSKKENPMRVTFALSLACVAVLTASCGPTGPSHPKAKKDTDLVFKGTYADSCQNIAAKDGYLTAECAGADGFKPTKIHAALCVGDIGNLAGTLVCNGAKAEQVSASATTTAPAKP